MKVAAFLINMCRGAFLDAWILMLMWRWFVTPLDVPALGYWQAMGLDLMVGFLLTPVIYSVVTHGQEAKKSGQDALAEAIAKVFVALSILGIAALIAMGAR